MNNFSARLVCAFLFLIVFPPPGILAQDTNTPAGGASDAVFDNKNVRVVRYIVLPGRMLTLPILKLKACWLSKAVKETKPGRRSTRHRSRASDPAK